MANEWFRWWHGTITDPKFMWVSRRVTQCHGNVVTVWAALLEHASQAHKRGSIDGFDAASFDCLLGTEDGVTQQIIDAFEAKGMIHGGLLVGWERRQPKREDQGNQDTGAKSAAERKREQRERDRAREEKQNDESRNITQCHDESRNVTLDKSRQDVDTPPLPPQGEDVGTWDVDDEEDVGCDPASSADPVAAKRSRRASERTTFEVWIKGVKERGEKPVTDHKALWEYAESAGLPREFIELAWFSFSDHYRTDEKAKRKLYADWKGTFLNAVKGNYRRLWYWSERDNAYRLTTVGQQLEMTLREAA